MSVLVGYSYYAILILVLAWAGSLAWRWFSLPRLAVKTYEANIEQALLDERIVRSDYVRSFVRAEGPRLATYYCVMALIYVLCLPIAVTILSGWFNALWFDSGLPMGPNDVAQIMLDFLVILILMAIFAVCLGLVTAYCYHTRPPSLRQEIQRLKTESETRLPVSNKICSQP